MSYILIVDDQACIRELIRDELNLEGYQSIAVGDAESMKEHLKISSPDLVILDLQLEDTDGFELFKAIKRYDPSLPIIIFTAYDTYKDDIRLSMADGYIIKGIDLGPLKDKISDVVERKSYLYRPAEPDPIHWLPEAVHNH